MELSTIIILLIAVFIVIYRIKTWNDIDPVADVTDASKETPKAKQNLAKETPNAHQASKPKSKRVKEAAPKDKTVSKKESTPKKESDKGAKTYKKRLKKGVKNELLAQMVQTPEQNLKTLIIEDQPQKGVHTYIALAESEDVERACGYILQKEKEGMLLIKSFDVKRLANGSFKVSTAFSKALLVNPKEMRKRKIKVKYYALNDNERCEIEQLSITLV